MQYTVLISGIGILKKISVTPCLRVYVRDSTTSHACLTVHELGGSTWLDSIVNDRNPTACSGGGGAPTPTHVFMPR